MEIKKFVEDKTLTVELIGRLDAVTSLELDKVLKDSFAGIKKIIFDLTNLNYIASAGLRILLKYQKQSDKNGCEMQIKNVQSEVRDVLNMTGFSDFLNISDGASKKLSIEF